MFTYEHYVPVLKWKQGEYLALIHLSTQIRRRITPLIEIQDIPWDYKAGKPGKTLAQHLCDVPAQIRNNWGVAPAFIYVDLVTAGAVTPGVFPLKYLGDAAHALGATLVPVLSSQSSTQSVNDAQSLHQSYGAGVAVRLLADDFVSRNPLQVLNNMLQAVGTTASETDVLLDMGDIPATVASSVFQAKAMVALQNATVWRSFTLISGAFPINLSGMGANTIVRVPRTDWQLFQWVLGTNPTRIPTFGDYGISHPELTQMDPRLITMSGNIRYTANNDFVLSKGHSIKQAPGWGQMRTLAQNLIAQPEYCGAAYSYGDGYINDCAVGTVGTGNASIWRRVGTNHHLTLVVNQLATHFGFSP